MSMWENNDTFAGGYGATNANAGGFMDTSTNFGTPSSKKPEQKSKNLVAVTVRTILNMAGDVLKVADTNVHMVVVCGIVRAVDEGASKTVYTIDDHTGTIEVTQFHEDEDSVDKGNVAENLYARIHGTVRNTGGTPSILSFKIAQVEDPNMITTHLLEVIHNRYKLQQLHVKKEGGSGGVTGSQPVLANSSLQQSSTGGGAVELVCDAIRSFASATGVSKTMIRQALAGKLAAAAVDQTVEELLSEGLIYSTTDEDHFLVIDHQ